MLEAAEQVRASQQLTDEQLGQLVRKTGHAPRLLVPKQHHQLVQAQAQHATAAARRASATRTATALAIREQQRRREQKIGGGQQRCSRTERIDWR